MWPPWTINTVADLIFFRYIRVEGLALGHATAYTFAAIVSAIILRRRIGGLEGRTLVPALVRIAVAGLACGAAAFLVAHWVGATLGVTTFGAQLLQVTAGIVAGGAAFLAVAAAFRLQELTLVRSLFRPRSSRG
jgi:putative peptidoglycan lipid II flippase